MARGAAKAKLDTSLLVKEFVEVRRAKRALEKRYDLLKDQVLGLGLTIVPGDNYSLVLVARSRGVLDTKLLIAQFGQKWYDSRCSTTAYFEVQVVENN